MNTDNTTATSIVTPMDVFQQVMLCKERIIDRHADDAASFIMRKVEEELSELINASGPSNFVDEYQDVVHTALLALAIIGHPASVILEYIDTLDQYSLVAVAQCHLRQFDRGRTPFRYSEDVLHALTTRPQVFPEDPMHYLMLTAMVGMLLRGLDSVFPDDVVDVMHGIVSRYNDLCDDVLTFRSSPTC